MQVKDNHKEKIIFLFGHASLLSFCGRQTADHAKKSSRHIKPFIEKGVKALTQQARETSALPMKQQ